ncbi:MAG TPA: hypothetical protein PK129_05070 [Cellvibrionaceae bacterium]|nr:hypothetical protein [Cellvibrionaceae bacterium]
MPSKQQRRNGHAFHPIMKKGGAHGKNKKAQRKAAKHQLHKHLQEGLGRSFWCAVFKPKNRSRVQLRFLGLKIF